MLFRLRLIIADPALFYVEESLKSLSQVRNPFIFLIHSMPKEYVNFPPWQSFLSHNLKFPQTSSSSYLMKEKYQIQGKVELCSEIAFTILYLLCKARVVTVSEQQKAGDTAVTLERGGTVRLQTRAVMVQSTSEASFFITHSRLLLNVQSKGDVLSHNLKDHDMKKGLWCLSYRPSKCYRPKQVPISNNSSPLRRFDIQNWWALIPRACSDPATLRPLGNLSDPGVKPW